jgi:hypothetical protein
LYARGFILGIDRNIAIGWKKRKMTKDKALEMSLTLLEQLNIEGWILEDFEPQMYACITAIKEALAQPVIGSCVECGIGDGYALYCVECSEKYVKRRWVGLTDEDEIDWKGGGTLKDLIKAIEKKLKEKNES